MTMLYESWEECGGNWSTSKLVLQCRSKDKTKRMGARVWMTKKQLVERYGEEGAEAIIAHKTSDPELMKSHVRDHEDAPGVESMRQYLVLDMDQVVEIQEECITRMFQAAEESSSESESSESSSSSDKKRKRKNMSKGKKENKKDKKD